MTVFIYNDFPELVDSQIPLNSTQRSVKHRPYGYSEKQTGNRHGIQKQKTVFLLSDLSVKTNAGF